MKYFLPILFVLLTGSVLSQLGSAGKPDYTTIEKAVSKKKSPYYYPKLFKRYLEGDSTMTMEEERHLYYGFTSRDEYDPYGRSEYEDSLQTMFEKDTIVQEDYMKIIDITNKIVEKFPFHLSALSYRTYAYRMTDQQEEYLRSRTQMYLILRVILTSGDGISAETAFYVISVPDEYEVLSALEYSFSGSQSLVGQCDYLTIRENEEDIEGLYFNVSPSLNHLSKMFK
jgi:hypothetical protein